MACSSPIYRIDLNKYRIPQKYYHKAVNGGVIFGLDEYDKFAKVLDPHHFQQLRCGSCIDCRLNYSHQWAVRCMLESEYHERCYFVTLTYEDSFLPKGNFVGYDGQIYESSLSLKDIQKFLKRLRKRFNKSFRYFYCGEYGELNHRPHYHLILFGTPDLDLQFLKSQRGINYYRSSVIESAWTDPKSGISLGHVVVTDFNYDTAAYVTRYMMKKKKGKSVKDLLNADLPDGYSPLVNCFAHQSRMPGLAKAYFDDHKDSIYQKDQILYQKEYQVYSSKPPR